MAAPGIFLSVTPHEGHAATRSSLTGGDTNVGRDRCTMAEWVFFERLNSPMFASVHRSELLADNLFERELLLIEDPAKVKYRLPCHRRSIGQRVFLASLLVQTRPRDGPMSNLDRSLRRAVKPLSTGLTRAWCSSRLFRWAVSRGVSFLSEMPGTRCQRRSPSRRD